MGAVGREVVRPLRLRRPVERLQDHAVGVGAVAREAAHHLVVLLVAVGHRRAGRDRDGPADDGVRAEVAGREVPDVHAAAAPVAVAFVLAEQLGDHAVDVLLERGLQQRGAAPWPSGRGTRALSCSSDMVRIAAKPLAIASPWPR